MSRARRAAAGRGVWVAALALLAAACGGPAPGPSAVTLVFKHARILGPVDPIPGLLREFEARHPGVRVRSEVLPWNADEQHQFYVVNLEGGRPGFDVFMLDVIWVPEFARAGWLLDLTSHVDPAALDAFFPSTVAAARLDGRLWALPWNMNIGLLFYRRDLLDRHGFGPPATYAELAGQVRAIRAADPRLEGYLWQGKQYEGLVVNVLEGLWANGTDLLDAASNVLPDPDRAAEVLATMRELIATGVSPAWVTAADEELGRRPFGDGRAIFYRGWPYAWDLFERADSPVRGKVGIAELPRHLHGTAAPGSTGGSHLGVHRDTRHPEAAVALARFLTGEEAQRRITESGALKPARTALYHDPAMVARMPVLPRLHALSLAGRQRPVTPWYLVLSTTLQPELSAALVGVKAPPRSVSDARRQLHYLIGGPGAALAGAPR